MTVYIEYVLINNFIIDYFILKATFTISGITGGRKRLLFCALISAIFSLIFPLIKVKQAFLSAIKICFGLLVVLISARYRLMREYYICTIVFFSITFLTGGAVSGIYSLLGVNVKGQTPIALVFIPASIVCKLLLKLIIYLYRRKDVMGLTYQLELTVTGVTQRLKGFLDTGNGLYDGDSPCVIINESVARRFLSEKLPPLKRITVNTVNGVSQKICIKNASVRIYAKDKPNIIDNVTVVVSKENIGDGYQVILHPSMIKEKEYESVNSKTKKVS